MGRIFGTDGARGVAVTELTCERAMEIGRAAAYVLTKESGKAHPNIIVGMDTRISSKILEAALSCFRGSKRAAAWSCAYSCGGLSCEKVQCGRGRYDLRFA